MIDQALLNSQFKNFLQQEGASEKTQKNYSADLEDFFTVLKKHSTFQTVEDITEEDITWYINETLNNGKSVSTINRRLSTLRVFFKFIQTIHPHAVNPMQRISNLIHQDDSIPHIELVKAYESTLITKGVQPTNIHRHKTVISDFLKWINKQPPS